MTAEEIIANCCIKQQEPNGDKVVEEYLKQVCHEITIHCPHLDKNLRPRPELVYGHKCPNGKDGQCFNCDSFICFKNNEDGTVFAFNQFTGYCAKEEGQA